MNIKKFTLGNSQVQISTIVMGTSQAGKHKWIGIEDAVSIQTLRAAFEAGITTIDTAAHYGAGHSERIVAEALSSVREQVEYATKVFVHHLKYNQVIEDCERSLKRLKTDYIDLYYIHWPSGSFNSEIVPIEETMSALNHLEEQVKIRAIGVSNFSRTQLAEAASYGRIDSFQPPFSLFWRQVEKDALPYCIENNISTLAYAPLAQGLLTGKFAPGHKFDPADNRARNKLFQSKNLENAAQALERLRYIAAEHSCSLAQLALTWLIAQDRVHPIVGARCPEQAKENALATEVRLSVAELAQIDAIGRTVTDHLDDNPDIWDRGQVVLQKQE